MERIKAVFNWSGGKDSAHALAAGDAVGQIRNRRIADDRKPRHAPLDHARHPDRPAAGTADSIGIPLHIVDLTPKGNMEDYGAAMSRAVEHFKAQGVTCFIFGDIFLHDVRKYRERQLAPHGIGVAEPLWGESSGMVMHDFLASGLRTVIVTTMADSLGARRHRAGNRPRIHRLAACRRRSQRRERRIPHILLRRADLPHPRPVPARHAFAPKLPHPP